MKKVLAMIISVLLIVSLIACSNQNEPEVNNGAINPVSESSIKEIENELGLSNIKFDDTVGAITKIDGDTTIYSIEITNDKTTYDLRICKEYENGDADISGVYLDGKIAGAIFDSANEYIAPSASCEASSNGTKAHTSWMGYNISLSTDKKVDLDEFQALFNNLSKSLLSSKIPKLVFEKSNDDSTNIEYDAGDYKIKSIGGKPMILLGDIAYSIKDAIESEYISSDDIIYLFGMPDETYKDGGSQLFNLDDCTVVNMNTLDSNKDIIIGPKGEDLYEK